MSEKLATELSKLNRFSNGRRLFVLKAILRIAAELNLPEIIAAAQWALVHERDTRKLERRWRQVRSRRSKGRGKAKELDIQLDRVIGAMVDSLRSLLVPLNPNSALAKKVRAFLDTYFPEGADAITSAEYEDALAIIEEMNEDFAALKPEQLTELNIQHHVPELARLAPLFHAELDKPSDGMRFMTLRDARLEGHERLCELVAGILFVTRNREDPTSVENRSALLAPVLSANARVSERRKRKNGPDVEVDPNTGEELEEGQDLVDEVDVEPGVDDDDGENP